MRVLVTGGAGYIGSHAARALKKAGFEVVIYDNLSTGHRSNARGFELCTGDISDRYTLMSVLSDVDAVMHFAASAYVGESVTNPRKYFDNNAIAAMTLLNAVTDSGIKKFVFSSSCAVYGVPLASEQPITEECPRIPVNPYGASKLFFENALEAYSTAYGSRSVSLRYFNAAGADESGELQEKHDPETHLIPLAFAAARTGPRLHVYGDDYPTLDGTCIRDYVHVNDIADAHVRALQYLEIGGETSAMNIGSGRATSVFEIIRAVAEHTHRTVRSTIVPRRKGDPPQLIASYAKARTILSWTPKRNLKDIIRTAAV
jgi:UDP-glucose-4-epimerase GalE